MKDNAMHEYFGEKGLLSSNLSSYEYRIYQEEMSNLIWDMIENNRPGRLAIEASTGLGKTFASLVPVMLWVKNYRKKALFLTATITLQEQLIRKDLPGLMKIMNLDLSYGNLKGRNNYVCRRLANNLFSQGYLSFNDSGEVSSKVFSWICETDTGDLAELSLPSDHPVLPTIASSFHKCSGQHCPYREACFYNQKLKDAREWDIVISNYHLFFSFLLKGKGGLPFSPDIIICDEAHKIVDAARKASSVEDCLSDWTNFFSQRNISLLEKKCLELSLSGNEVKDKISHLFSGISNYFHSAELSYENRISITTIPELMKNEKENICSLLSQVGDLLQPAKDHLASLSENSGFIEEEDSHFFSWLNEFNRISSSFRFVSDISLYPDWSYWREGQKITASPTRCSEIIDSCFQLLQTDHLVFVSATLTINGSFDYWKHETGLYPETERVYPSEFLLADKMEIWVVDIGFSVMQSGYDKQVCRVVERLCDENMGKSLVLLSSKRLLANLAQHFSGLVKPYRILVQGELPKGDLLQLFRQNTDSVLIGMVSFREGIDVPGESLSQVIIDRIPFPHPNDPIIQTRNRLEGSLAFMNVTLPIAKMTLKQAAGRLIRTHTDKGRVVILDKRVIERPDWNIQGVLPQVKYRYLKTKGSIVA